MSVEEMNKRMKTKQTQPSAPPQSQLTPQPLTPSTKAPITPRKATGTTTKSEEDNVKETKEDQSKETEGTDVQWGIGEAAAVPPVSDVVSTLEVEGRVIGSPEEGVNYQGAAEETVLHHPCIPEEKEEGIIVGEGINGSGKRIEEEVEKTPSAEDKEESEKKIKSEIEEEVIIIGKDEEKKDKDGGKEKEDEEADGGGEKKSEEMIGKDEKGETNKSVKKEEDKKEGETGSSNDGKGGGGSGDKEEEVEKGEVVEVGEKGEIEEGDVGVEAMIREKEDAQNPSRKVENNFGGGGIGVPIDLSVGLLGADIDDRPKEETCSAFTTLPSEAPFSPPPRPKNLSCSYPSGTLKLSPEEIEEHPMSASFTIPNIGLNGKDNGPSSVSANPNSKHHGQMRHQKPSSHNREGRRSLVVRQGMQKQGSSSAAPSVQQKRSSSMSTLLFPETLPPCKNPKESLKQSFQSMDDPDWEVAMKGLETLVRLIRHHPSYVQSELTKVIATLARQIRNLRSQVARAACQASGELALPRVTPASPSSINSSDSISSSSSSLLRRALEADLEEVAAPLLHRSADTNRFLRDDCVAALDRFVSGVGPSRVVGPILSKGVTHQNALVRTVTARLLATIVSKLGAERVMTQLNKDVRAKVLRAGAQLLMEGSLQTRTFAKQVFRCLAAHENFDRCLAQAVPTPVLRNIHKTLISIKKESIASNGLDPNWDA